MQLTLVAYYGNKPEPLRRFVTDVNELLQSLLVMAFVPYRLPQVHATIVGLEGIISPENFDITSRNYHDLRGESRSIKLDEIAGLVENSPFLPMTVHLGGFNADAYPFTSRGLHPRQRSFGFDGNRVVVMGWPARDGEYPTTLDSFRRSFNAANVLHKYHGKPDDIDNDLFFVIGTIDRDRLPPHELDAAEARLRDFVASYPPVELRIEPDTLHIVGYEDPALPPQRSVVVPVTTEAKELRELYLEEE